MGKIVKHALAACVAAVAFENGALAQTQVTSTSTMDIGVVVGPDRYFPDFYGADVGTSAEWRDGGSQKVTIMFGDTHKNASDPDGEPVNNDSVTTFALSAAPNSGVALDGLAETAFDWRDMTIKRNGSELVMDGGKTPISMAAPTHADAPFGFFNRATYAKCILNSDCGAGLVCDRTMGALAPFSFGENVVPCAQTLGNLACLDIDLNPFAGLCRDQTSSLVGYVNWSIPSGVPFWDLKDGAFRSEAGKILSTAVQQEVGYAVVGDPSTYNTKKFITNKFANASMRMTVSTTDHNRAVDDNAAATLWIWGRPSFYSNSAQGARAELYLARAPNPKFTGGVMQLEYRRANGTWSTDESQAAPVEVTPGAEWEDGVVNFTSITHVAGKWVMLYGGDTPALWDGLFGGAILQGMDRGNGAVKVRIADNPWGPWGKPKDVLLPTSSAIAGRLCPNTGASCNPFGFPEVGPGLLYGAQIVESWSEPIGANVGARIGWVVSLWNPYQVEQLQTDVIF